MKKLTCWIALAAVSAALAAPAFAGSGEKCSQDAQTCLNHFSAKKGKGYMGIEYDKNAAGAMVVSKVIKGAPAEKAGFQLGDVLISRNGIKMDDYEAMKADKDSWKVGARVSYTVLRKSAEKTVAVTLGQLPEDAYQRMVGAHMINDHMAVVTATATSEEKK